MRVLLGGASKDVRDYMLRSGGQWSRLLDDAQKAPGTMGEVARGIKPLREAGQKLVTKAFDLNSFFDDAYRVMAYLYAHDKTVKGKLNPRELKAAQATAGHLRIGEAEAAGVNLARRVMQNWDELTPFERTVVRGIFPFYSWTQHILRFTARYPIDHPVRASIMASFAENEVNDFGTALPKRLLNTFFLGNPDPETGDIKGINLNSINPFADVANYFTMAGWLSAANPIFATMLEQIGVDGRLGQVGLFPDTHYDPMTGSLKVDTPNPATSLLFNTIPQTQAIAHYLGMSTDIKDIMQTNPEAAQRMLASSFGLPVYWRDYNYVEEVAQHELTKETAYRKAYTDALKSGSLKSDYPTLSPLLAQFKVLQQGNVVPYPTTTGI